MKETWDSRYKTDQYVYGLKPNDFLKYHLKNYPPGEILLPGDGEGRNSIFAAKQGWKVTAFDYSISAKDKALSLAKRNKVKINFQVTDAESFNSKNKFDLISIIFLHLPPNIRYNFHSRLTEYLNPNGKILLECFSKFQVHNNSGGPKDLDLLYSLNDLKNDFSNCKIESIEEMETLLNEGSLHQGKANVIRLIAKQN